MTTISLDYINDIIATCKDGDLLITYYRSYDVGLERIEELFKYIDEHKSSEYNWVKIDVSDLQDECNSHCIFPPCTIWYNNGWQRISFTSYDSGSDIVNRMRRFNEYAMRAEPQEHIEVGDTWFFNNTIYPRIEVPNE